MKTYEEEAAEADKILTYWQAIGCSRKQGNATKRNGALVTCGHRHKTESACAPCLSRMKGLRPGGCQDYRAANLTELIFIKRKP